MVHPVRKSWLARWDGWSSRTLATTPIVIGRATITEYSSWLDMSSHDEMVLIKFQSRIGWWLSGNASDQRCGGRGFEPECEASDTHHWGSAITVKQRCMVLPFLWTEWINQSNYAKMWIIVCCIQLSNYNQKFLAIIYYNYTYACWVNYKLPTEWCTQFGSHG